MAKSVDQLLAGKWCNQHGSELDLEVQASGVVRGTFRSGVGLAEPSEAFAVAGFATGDVIAFVVDFSRCGSVTSWCGHVVDGSIETLWHMAIDEQHTWKGTWTGSDVFRREPFNPVLRAGRVPSHPLGWRNAEALPGAIAGSGLAIKD